MGRGGAVSDVLVLCYHALSPTWSASLSVTPDDFERQLRLLVGRGWRGATFSEAVLRAPWPRTLAVTFDDAFLSVLELALPIMARLGVPGTVFAPTSFMDRRMPLMWDGTDQWAATPDAQELQSMCWDDLQRLIDQGWEVGSHTRTHPRLSRLDDDALRAELEGSRSELERHLSGTCESLAYPYGDVDERVVARARELGYRCAAGLSSSLAPLGPHRFPRVGVYREDPGWRFRLKVNGLMRRARASKLWPAHE
jgi:peptidoglycan/xylan/chitin deacetylase (PgdA/CDA1 family)